MKTQSVQPIPNPDNATCAEREGVEVIARIWQRTEPAARQSISRGGAVTGESSDETKPRFSFD